MTASILTNLSAMTALQNLTATQSALTTTQQQISSGLKVSTASDNAAYWSISSTMKSDTGALSAVSDALNLGTSVLNVAATAMAAALTSMNTIKADLVTAQQPGASTASVQADIKAQQQSLIAVLGSASFNGVNLLDSLSGPSTSFVTSFTRSSTGATSIGTSTFLSAITVNSPVGVATGTGVFGLHSILGGGVISLFSVSSTVLGQASTGTGAGTYSSGSVLSFDITSASASDLTKLQAAIEAATASLTNVATRIATIQTTVSNQQTYVSALSDAITSGVGSLVDADMNVTSTRLQALQTQQQLGIQALSIANQNSQIILKLFQAA